MIENDGFQGLWGDSSSDQILHAAGVDRARVLLLTIPDVDSLHLTIDRARARNPGVLLIVRSRRPEDLELLRSKGVAAAVQPEFEGGLELVRQAMLQFGHDEQAVREIVERRRGEYYSAILKS